MSGAATSEPKAGAQTVQVACDNCDEQMLGAYCHRCGAPQLSARDLSIRAFFRDAIADVTNFERSKLLRTLWLLCSRPGLLTLDNFSGRRVRYLKPISLTLAVFALHLFVFTAAGEASSFNVERLAKQSRKAPNPAGQMWRAIEAKAAASGTTTPALADDIDQDWIRNFSFFQIPLIAFLACWIRLLLLFSRHHFVLHAVFAMHLISFTGFTVVLLYPLLYAAGPGFGALSAILIGGKFLFDWGWVSLAARRVYVHSMWRAVLLGLLIEAGYFAAFQISNQLALAMSLRSNLG